MVERSGNECQIARAVPAACRVCLTRRTDMVSSMISHAQLKQKQRTRRDGFTEAFGLRIHRAISWLGRAEAETEDHDVRFILAWIAFNAAYAREDLAAGLAEREDFRTFFARLVALDTGQRIYQIIWTRYSQEIRVILENRYVFSPFWQYHNGVAGYENWEERFVAARRRINNALRMKDSAVILEILFDRLYMLRNQLVHGGSTWNGSVNREQVRDGANILSTLLPVFIDIMMDNHSSDWGRAYYPVVR